MAGPVKLLVHGQPAVGKSTFAAAAPSPVFLDFENRTGHLDVARLQPATWDDTLAVMRELVVSPGDYRTVVFDTLDAMEVLMHKAVCERNGWTSIEDPGYGKGYAVALLDWTRFLNGCEALRAKGLNTILLAHSVVRTVKSPVGDDYDKVDLKLKGGPKTNSGDLVTAVMDLVGYGHHEDLAKKNAKDPNARAKAITTGRRLLTFKHSPAFTSKRGVPMADETDLTWAAFSEALAKHAQ